ncbi:MAG: hypothetical protein IJ128_04760 [Firmicutes bacterium]|nr:hypothetical protein [Bacillota bacterium]
MDLTQFRKEILITTICMAALAELISLPVIGPSLPFGIGVCAGTATTILSFLILVKIGNMMDAKKTSAPMVGGYFVRMLLYGAVFFICIRASIPCGFGCLAGFITLHFGILILYGIVYRFILKKKNPLNDWTEPKEWNDLSIYDDEDDDW